jgi:hypothetical protein
MSATATPDPSHLIKRDEDRKFKRPFSRALLASLGT